MVLVAPSTLLVRIMKCDQLIYRSMVNKSQEKTKNSLECWNMKLRWMDHVDKRPNLLLPLIECLRHKVYCRLFLFLHPSVRPSTRHGQLLYHRSYFIYSQLLKMGLSSARTHPLQNRPPQFWPPSPNTQQLQFRSLPKIELYFLFSLSFCKTSTPIFLCLVPSSVYTNTHTWPLSVSTSFQLNFSFPFLAFSLSGRMTYFVTK